MKIVIRQIMNFNLLFLALSREITNARTETKTKQEKISILDEDAKRAHNQYKLNRDNYERYMYILKFNKKKTHLSDADDIIISV